MPQKCICLHLRSGVKGKHGDASNEKKKGTRLEFALVSPSAVAAGNSPLPPPPVRGSGGGKHYHARESGMWWWWGGEKIEED